MTSYNHQQAHTTNEPAVRRIRRERMERAQTRAEHKEQEAKKFWHLDFGTWVAVASIPVLLFALYLLCLFAWFIAY